jgi:hypothetical protein
MMSLQAHYQELVNQHKLPSRPLKLLSFGEGPFRLALVLVGGWCFDQGRDLPAYALTFSVGRFLLGHSVNAQKAGYDTIRLRDHLDMRLTEGHQCILDVSEHEVWVHDDFSTNGTQVVPANAIEDLSALRLAADWEPLPKQGLADGDAVLTPYATFLALISEAS